MLTHIQKFENEQMSPTLRGRLRRLLMEIDADGDYDCRPATTVDGFTFRIVGPDVPEQATRIDEDNELSMSIAVTAEDPQFDDVVVTGLR